MSAERVRPKAQPRNAWGAIGERHGRAEEPRPAILCEICGESVRDDDADDEHGLVAHSLCARFPCAGDRS